MFELTQARGLKAMQLLLAHLVGLGVYWLWPRLDLPRLGAEQVWFAMAWMTLLLAPLFWRSADVRLPTLDERHLVPAWVFTWGVAALACLFLVFLLAAPGLGNYKLWLGVAYLSAVLLRLAGLTLWLRGALLEGPRQELRGALMAGGVAALGCLLLIPWVRPELCAVWPPSPRALASPLAVCLLWGGIAGAAPMVMRLWGGGRRAAWLTFLAVGLGPLPALALALLPLPHLTLALLILAGLAGLRLATGRAPAREPDQPDLLPLYWLLRALLLLWWGVGVALTLAVAWWQPRVWALLSESLWLRAVGLGAFLVACLGLLAEYSLPLVSKAGVPGPGRERKLLGVVMSALALLAALSPLLLVRFPQDAPPPPALTERPRAELLSSPVSLSPANPQVELPVPSWLSRVSRLYLVSLLTNAAHVAQGETVAQLVASDDQDIPYIFNLRAGVDTAEWALDKRDVAISATHGLARPAQSWTVFAPTGEAFRARAYLAGLYLGGELPRLKNIRLRYLYSNPPDQPPVTLEIRRLFLN